MPIDCHTALIIIPLSSGAYPFTFSVWRPPVIVATTAGCRGDRHDCWRNLGILKATRIIYFSLLCSSISYLSTVVRRQQCA
ncbi:hypothetical protein Y032_0949g3176 [Ancylostoma ceylanicum]|uniref:Uncharacterized protein n=1 Tax=Ancylostoma ceylanicum TaxID=53326 RepID=A0A016WAF1_9BILA|nr:hypothetical protein Y032_0949g3176 [Ancylostoma ceylanicum]